MKQDKYSREWTYRIQDILQAINKIETYIQSMTLSDFKKNELVIDAVIRNFEIIGEASHHIPKKVKLSHPKVMWIEIYGMRNILIHEYFGVEVETVWHTAKKHLPTLKEQLSLILKEV